MSSGHFSSDPNVYRFGIGVQHDARAAAQIFVVPCISLPLPASEKSLLRQRASTPAAVITPSPVRAQHGSFPTAIEMSSHTCFLQMTS